MLYSFLFYLYVTQDLESHISVEKTSILIFKHKTAKGIYFKCCLIYFYVKGKKIQ